MLILAHGAGAPANSEWMTDVVRQLESHGLIVYGFNFPYMAVRTKTGRKLPPDRLPVLLSAWREAITEVCRIEKKKPSQIFVGGKSLGVRTASHIADELGVRGLIGLGYPFHPPDQPKSKRWHHMKTIKTPTLILQGSRDPFGNKKEFSRKKLSPKVTLVWLEDGDHSWETRKKSGFTLDQHMANAAECIKRFVASHSLGKQARER